MLRACDDADLHVALQLLCVGETYRRRKETVVQKQMFKVLAAIPKRDGGHFWMRCGTGHTNKDDSINVYLDALPKGAEWKFQLRELDEEDLRRRDGGAARPPPGQSSPAGSGDSLPF